MRFLPTVLLLLSFPAGIVGYAVGAWVMSVLPLPGAADGLLAMFVSLLVGGLFMMPFLIPFFDRMAKRDLEAYRQAKEAAAKVSGDEPDGGRG